MLSIWATVNDGDVVFVFLMVVFLAGIGAAMYVLASYFITFITDKPRRDRVRAEREARMRKQLDDEAHLDGEAVHRWLDQAGSEEDS